MIGHSDFFVGTLRCLDHRACNYLLTCHVYTLTPPPQLAVDRRHGLRCHRARPHPSVGARRRPTWSGRAVRRQMRAARHPRAGGVRLGATVRSHERWQRRPQRRWLLRRLDRPQLLLLLLPGCPPPVTRVAAMPPMLRAATTRRCVSVVLRSYVYAGRYIPRLLPILPLPRVHFLPPHPTHLTPPIPPHPAFVLTTHTRMCSSHLSPAAQQRRRRE